MRRFFLLLASLVSCLVLAACPDGGDDVTPVDDSGHITDTAKTDTGTAADTNADVAACDGGLVLGSRKACDPCAAGERNLVSCDKSVMCAEASGGQLVFPTVAGADGTVTPDLAKCAMADTGVVTDTTVADTGTVDTATDDTGTVEDTTVDDTGKADTGTRDTGTDSGVTCSKSEGDVCAAECKSICGSSLTCYLGKYWVAGDVADLCAPKPDVGVDTGPTDSGVTDSGSSDTGKADTGKPDTGKPDTGPAVCSLGYVPGDDCSSYGACALCGPLTCISDKWRSATYSASHDCVTGELIASDAGADTTTDVAADTGSDTGVADTATDTAADTAAPGLVWLRFHVRLPVCSNTGMCLKLDELSSRAGHVTWPASGSCIGGISSADDAELIREVQVEAGVSVKVNGFYSPMTMTADDWTHAFVQWDTGDALVSVWAEVSSDGKVTWKPTARLDPLGKVPTTTGFDLVVVAAPSALISETDADGDGSQTTDKVPDPDDHNPAAHPDAVEDCEGADLNGNGEPSL